MTSPNAEGDGLLEEALRSITGLERLLWGRLLRRDIPRSGTRLARCIEKYGVPGGTRTVVAEYWLAPSFAGLLAVALGAGNPGPLRESLSVMCWCVFGISMAFWAFRIVTAWLAIRKSKDEAGPGAPY
jgi:hypothetical protein